MYSLSYSSFIIHSQDKKKNKNPCSCRLFHVKRTWKDDLKNSWKILEKRRKTTLTSNFIGFYSKKKQTACCLSWCSVLLCLFSCVLLLSKRSFFLLVFLPFVLKLSSKERIRVFILFYVTNDQEEIFLQSMKNSGASFRFVKKRMFFLMWVSMQGKQRWTRM